MYQAYYTRGHLFHADRFGKEAGTANVRPEQMIDEVWDCVFGQRSMDENSIKRRLQPKQGVIKHLMPSYRR